MTRSLHLALPSFGETFRLAVVLSCAGALIAAGRFLPF